MIDLEEPEEQEGDQFNMFSGYIWTDNAVRIEHINITLREVSKAVKVSPLFSKNR